MVSAENSDIGARLGEAELCPDDLLKGQEAAFARDIERLQRQSSDFVTVLCPGCGGESGSKAFNKAGFTYRRCGGCATIYMSPRPSEVIMADYYANSENYAYWAKHIFPASEESRCEKIHKPWLQRVIGYCQSYRVTQGTLLEVGPGFGTFSSVAVESGAFKRVVAVEPTPELADACRRRGIEVINRRIEDLSGEVAMADIVVAFEVIEHLFEPRRFLESIYPITAPGGLVVLSCPNGLGFDIAMLGADALAVDAEHVNLFNPTSLAQLMDTVGFEVLQSQTPGRLDAEFVRDAALAGRVTLDAFLQRVLLDEWEEHGWPFQQFIAQQGLSSHMWIVARRPF